MLTPFTAFWAPERQLSLLNIRGSEFQHFADSHSTPGHQFQDKSVSWPVCPEDDFIDDVLFNNCLQLNHGLRPCDPKGSTLTVRWPFPQ